MKYAYLIILFFISFVSLATHNRAGEISFKQIGVNQFEITLITYTRIETDADRPIIEINWGDGSIDSLSRSEGFPEFIAFDINKNEYKSIHTFPGPGKYTVYLEDPNRNDDVSNIPNSVNVPFYIESEIVINPFLGYNNSPTLLNPPVEEACANSIFQHNPSAFDEDGDSLVFSLIEAYGLGGEPIPGYSFPEGASINSKTGTLTWDKPTVKGEFNLAILIQEYRSGFLIGSMIRDMQVSVKECENNPPEIKSLQDVCVEAGTTINFKVIATDNDTDQTITLTASGGPLSGVSGDLAVFSEVLGEDSISGNFLWNTGCSHVRYSPYQVFFKAQDNDSEVQLIDLHTLNITVIGPKVQNVTSTSQTNGINVSWTRSICEKVVGYKIYRKNNSSNWIPDSCETGVPLSTGYVLIGSTEDRENSTYLDESVVQGNAYCYRITAIYPDGAESIASDESCAKTVEISPIPTHVDVVITDSIFGKIFIQWKSPKDLDSLSFTGELFYKVYDIKAGVPNLIYASLNLNDTSFTHENINTQTIQKNYKLELIEKLNGNEIIISTSQKSSSVFLTATPADQTIHLKWNFSTPWSNDTTVILIEKDGVWEPIDSTVGNSFSNFNLTNGEIYCYRVLTLGEYSSNQSDTFLLNHSQEVCKIPEDLSPPCLPEITTLSDCDLNQNIFSWNIDTNDCNSDLTALNIFYKRFPEDEYFLLSTENSPWEDSLFMHNELIEVAGCYTFSVVDSVGNESEPTLEICFDNCPFYTLPNIFTPNGDNVNEIVIPFPYKYVAGVEMKIYNRWGQLVYQTNDRDISWDGRHAVTKLPCASGVYFYSCVVKEQRLNGTKDRLINGFIELIRN